MEKTLSAKDMMMLDQFLNSSVEIRNGFDEIKKMHIKGMKEWGLFDEKLAILSKRILGFYGSVKKYIQSSETAHLMQEKLAQTYNIDFDPTFDELCIQEFTENNQVIRMVLSSLYLREVEIRAAATLKENAITENSEEMNENYDIYSGSIHFNAIYAAILEREIGTSDNKELSSLFIAWLYDTLYCCASLRKFWTFESCRLYSVDEALLYSYSESRSGLNDQYILSYLELATTQLNLLSFNNDFDFKKNVAYQSMRLESCMLMLSDDVWNCLSSTAAEYPNESSRAGDLAYSQAIANTTKTKNGFNERMKVLIEKIED